MSHPGPLSSFPVGCSLQVCFLGMDAATAARLREVGIREGCQGCLVSSGDKCVLGIGKARIALRREVAERLFVTEAEPIATS